MRMCEQRRLHCTGQWGGRCHQVSMCTVWLSHSQWQWVQQWICIKFCVKLENPSTKLFRWFRKWHLWATGDWQLHHNTPAHASCLIHSFLVKHQITQVTQPLYSPELVPCDIWLFPKTKITFEREEISDHPWDSGKYDGAVNGEWENCVRSQGAYFERDWGIIVLCTKCLVSSSINVFIFHITWLDTFWTDLKYDHFYLQDNSVMLGTTLPGFRSCNLPWLRLSERPWDHKPLRRQSLSSW